MRNYVCLSIYLFSLFLASCDVFDNESGERIPGLCVNRVNYCPSEVLPPGDNGQFIVGSYDMPIYPHPDCLTIDKNDRVQRMECTQNKIIEYLDENIIYPKAAIDNAIEGPVYVTIDVSFPYACISSVEVSEDIGYGTACELQRVLELMPSLVRERESSHQVHYRYRFRYEFTL